MDERLELGFESGGSKRARWRREGKVVSSTPLVPLPSLPTRSFSLREGLTGCTTTTRRMLGRGSLRVRGRHRFSFLPGIAC